MIRALERAQASLGIRSGAAFARRLAQRTGGPPDPSTYQRWLRGDSVVPAWALLAAADEAQQSLDDLLGRDTQDRLTDLEERLAALENLLLGDSAQDPPRWDESLERHATHLREAIRATQTRVGRKRATKGD